LQRREQVVVVGVQRGDDLRRRVVGQLCEQLHAVAVGQLQVDQQQFERIGAVQPLRAAGELDLGAGRLQIGGLGDRDLVAEAVANHAAQKAARHRVVLDDKHLHGHRVTPRCSPFMLAQSFGAGSTTGYRR